MSTHAPSFEQPEMHPSRWGDPARETKLPEAARGLIEMAFGVHDTPAREMGALPEPGLPSAAYEAFEQAVGAENVRRDDETRRLRARGKSTPDLLDQRAGALDDVPDAVVRPGSHAEVQAVLDAAVEHRCAVIPFGGGTSVVGALSAQSGSYAGVISLDLIRMKALLEVDKESMIATLQPGLRGPEAEALLAEQGVMIGHFPQSFEYATIGGFAATRSSGQSSAGYGRFDAIVVALRLATPSGEWRLGSSPANAAGPDLRQVVLGSEGAFGVVTEVTVRVRSLPQIKHYEGWRWSSFAEGADAIRHVVQTGLQPTVLRLSDESETAINLAKPDAIAGENNPGCLMIVGFEGTEGQTTDRRAAMTRALERLGGTCEGTEPGQAWARGRFDAPYLRDALLDSGVLVETLETATWWSNRGALYEAIKQALVDELGEGTIVLCHISHVYETGCSLYFTVATAQSEDPSAQWLRAKARACEAITAHGATVTHHHAVGRDHKPWLTAEIGELGARVLRAIKTEIDPTGILNPGVLIP